MQDIAAAVRQYLLNDPDVDYHTGGRVYVGDIPDAEIANMPRQCLVIRARGGIEGNDFTSFAAPRFALWSYGSTRYEAGLVDGAAWNALHYMNRATVNDTLLHSAVLVAGALAEKEQDTGWPVQIRQTTVYASTESTV